MVERVPRIEVTEAAVSEKTLSKMVPHRLLRKGIKNTPSKSDKRIALHSAKYHRSDYTEYAHSPKIDGNVMHSRCPDYSSVENSTSLATIFLNVRKSYMQTTIRLQTATTARTLMKNRCIRPNAALDQIMQTGYRPRPISNKRAQ